MISLVKTISESNGKYFIYRAVVEITGRGSEELCLLVKWNQDTGAYYCDELKGYRNAYPDEDIEAVVCGAVTIAQQYREVPNTVEVPDNFQEHCSKANTPFGLGGTCGPRGEVNPQK